jgi:hypothetical protein
MVYFLVKMDSEFDVGEGEGEGIDFLIEVDPKFEVDEGGGETVYILIESACEAYESDVGRKRGN